MNENVSLPLLVIFGLDYTLWPFWVHSELSSPFTKTGFDKVIDSNGKRVLYFDDVPAILEKLDQDGIKVAIASATSDPKGSKQLLALFEWNQFISYNEIRPGKKTMHLYKIHKKSGVPFSDMIFFDDMYRELEAVSGLGVCGVKVGKKGMTMETLEKGFKHFAQLRSQNSTVLNKNDTTPASVADD